MLLVRAAAETHPELASAWAQMNIERLTRMTQHGNRLQQHGHLRADVTVAEARDVLWTYSAPELYDLLVQQQGCGAGMIEAGKQFRRVNGHLHLATLRAELQRVTTETVVPDHQNDTITAA
jgi:hypothetical protein